MPSAARVPYLRSARLDDGAPRDGYPFDLPAVRHLDRLHFGPVTILAGDNGTGKSTLVEAIAIAAGFNAEGGGRNLQFATESTHSALHMHLRLSWERRPAWGWFLRAETFYGMATHVANDPWLRSLKHPFPDLHLRSHGESFLELMEDRFVDRGLYIMDEPESALSFQGQLRMLRLMHDAVGDGSQFVIATHSPMIMAMPGASVYELDDGGLHRRDYDDLATVRLWRRFLAGPDRLFDELFSDD